MAQATDFLPEEWELLRGLPFVVAIQSLTCIHPNMSAMLDAVISFYSIRPSSPPRIKVIRSILSLLRPSVLKALRTAFSTGTILSDASKPFPTLQAMLLTDKSEGPPKFNAFLLPVRGKYQGSGQEVAIAIRNDLCEQARVLLSQKSSPQESREYRLWLLQITREMMRRGQFKSFLGFGKDLRATQVTQYLQDFAQVLQVSSEGNPMEREQASNHKGSQDAP